VSEKTNAIKQIADAAKTRVDVPKFTFGWASAFIAFGLIVLREYDTAWIVIQICAAISVLALVAACTGLAIRIVALMSIASIEGSEIMDGRVPTPDGFELQEKLKTYGAQYRMGKAVGLPGIVIGAVFTATTVVLLAIYHLVN
jgi:hypothetical protein